MTISMYSSNLRASDRMYEYSRHKLNRFIFSNGILLTSSGSTGSIDTVAAEGPATALSEQLDDNDIVIRERSYLAAGENLQIFGVERDSNILRMKTDHVMDIHINLTGEAYAITASEGGKNMQSISGSLPDKDVITLAIAVDMPNIKENEKIRLNVSLTNDSKKNVNITLDDVQKRVALYDRKGNRIYSGSTAENVRII